MAKNRRKKTLFDWSMGVTQELGEMLRFGAWERSIPPSTFTRIMCAKAVFDDGVPQRMADPARLKAYLDWSAKNAVS
jgi:hypothetical protein